ncbi:hypothetical protein CH274_05365 [Rhodococcus sp. 06-418-5]|uniref:HORMA-1 domain-containing protein n=1 Tax=Rhodococcus sp. 06-418-5 TaxID=2022507 RepID=UPI000B9BACA3|nr:hypothetical protein [Rhodococcus sp. 06-418-5]OZC85026.1 hypothetical protein CH274_04225 [Rhodococcus sp. 06-418-5]OZC85214.1 hypothetical protein CH274_05365 [Rhodococcus sp. 06-418-5]
MTSSYTRSATFTITNAREIAASVGADLRNLYSKYGEPDPSCIEMFTEELALYLRAGYLDFVQFGFRDEDRWVLKLQYTAVVGGHLRNDTPGNLPSAMAVVGHDFHSYLQQNSAFRGLSPEERAAFRATLPTSRTPGTAPTANRATSSAGTQFSNNGRGVDRTVYLDI